MSDSSAQNNGHYPTTWGTGQIDPQRAALAPATRPFRGSLLLGFKRDELAVVAAPEAECNLPAEIPPTGLLIGVDVRDALVDAVALGLGEGGGARLRQRARALQPQERRDHARGANAADKPATNVVDARSDRRGATAWRVSGSRRSKCATPHIGMSTRGSVWFDRFLSVCYIQSLRSLPLKASEHVRL